MLQTATGTDAQLFQDKVEGLTLHDVTRAVQLELQAQNRDVANLQQVIHDILVESLGADNDEITEFTHLSDWHLTQVDTVDVAFRIKHQLGVTLSNDLLQ